MVTFGAVNQTARNYARIRIPGSGRPVRRNGQGPLRQRSAGQGAVRSGQRNLGVSDHGYHVRRHGRATQADEGDPAGHFPAFGHSGPLARRRVQARHGRRSLAGRVQRAGSRRSARLRGRAEARVEARYGDAESLRAESLDDGRDHRAAGRKGRGDLRVGRRRGRSGQLQLPGPARHFGHERGD